MKKFWSWLKENSQWILNNRGQMEWLIPTLINVGADVAGSFFGGDDEPETYMPKVEFLEAPAAKWRGAPKPEQYAEFPEAEQARKTWFGKLQEWGKEPGYGAISPDWDDIWQRAQSKVSQYYWGGPGGQPGLAGKVRGSAARRGVSQSPALETELTRMGMQEASDIKGMATEQAVQEAKFGEAGRQNWFQSLMGLTGVRPRYHQPQGMWQQPYANVEQVSPVSTTPGMGELISELGSTVGTAYGQKQQQDWYSELLKDVLAQGGGLDTVEGLGDFSFVGGDYNYMDFFR